MTAQEGLRDINPAQPPDPDGATEGFATLEQILQLAPLTKIVVLTGQHVDGDAGLLAGGDVAP